MGIAGASTHRRHRRHRRASAHLASESWHLTRLKLAIADKALPGTPTSSGAFAGSRWAIYNFCPRVGYRASSFSKPGKGGRFGVGLPASFLSSSHDQALAHVGFCTP